MLIIANLGERLMQKQQPFTRKEKPEPEVKFEVTNRKARRKEAAVNRKSR